MRKNIALSICRIVTALVCLFLGVTLHAQYDNGSLVGTIKDPSGAPISGATVSIVNDATAISTQAKTNASGDYEVPSLKVGTYTISASANGFSDAKATNITISVGSRARIDLGLKVGSASASVEVTDVQLQLETETSERGETITNYQTEAFPLVSRNYSDLLGLIPGSRQAPSAATTSSISSLVRAGSYNVNGQRSMFNNFLLDGIDNNAYGESNQGFDNQIIAVPPDSVAQFQVVTNNESAEYGRSSGATINVASLGGTNRFHTTLYEFIRNTDLNATGFFKPLTVGGTGITTPFKKPTLDRNQFGFNFGGPILKDKFFFFLDYEGFRQTLTPLNVLSLPTQNEINGILVQPVMNPVTGTVYPAGQPIPTTAINPLSLQILSYFKQIEGALPVSGLNPGAGSTTQPTGLASNDWAIQAPFTDHSDKGDIRFDWQLTPTRSAFLRFSDRKENAINFETIPIPGIANGAARRPDQRPHPAARSADRSRVYAAIRIEQGSRHSAWPGPHQGRQVQLVDRQYGLQQHSGAADQQRRRSGRPSFDRHHWVHRLRPPEHQSAVAGSSLHRSEDELHLGARPPLAEVRLRVRA